jgi:hypothetical protein
MTQYALMRLKLGIGIEPENELLLTRSGQHRQIAGTRHGHASPLTGL